MKKISLALIGAGQRGINYGDYALKYPHEVQFTAVADLNPIRRERFRHAHNISPEHAYADWQELLAQPRLADALVICTQDKQHFAPTMAALAAGYDLLLEKPMSPDPIECLAMGNHATELQRLFLICHVLRYTSFFSTIKQLLESGEIGRLISIQHNENVAFWHYAHSYVRGNWRNSLESSPMILAKSCHDMDILLWLAAADCQRVSSFGSLSHFRPENAPPGAPLRCLDGCPASEECPYYAPRFYLTGKTGWPASTISDDTSQSGLLKTLQNGPYGRCVYHCDNNVVDHQVVNLEFSNGVTAAFSMCAFTDDVSRTIKLMGTRGEIRGIISDQRNELEVIDFLKGTHKVLHLQNRSGSEGHGGGDFGVMREFVHLLRQENKQAGHTSASTSVQSHLMAFAAEASRLTNNVITLSDFTANLQNAPS